MKCELALVAAATAIAAGAPTACTNTCKAIPGNTVGATDSWCASNYAVAASLCASPWGCQLVSSCTTTSGAVVFTTTTTTTKAPVATTTTTAPAPTTTTRATTTTAVPIITTTNAPTTTTTTRAATITTATATQTLAGVDCTEINACKVGSPYAQNMQCQVNGIVYQAKYYTSTNPETDSSSWNKVGFCDPTKTPVITQPPPPPNAKMMGGYYSNWAQYRKNGGGFKADQVDTSLYSIINYGFGKLLPDLSVANFEENDIDGYYGNPSNVGSYTTLRKKLKASNPYAKFVISFGGWNLSRGEGQKEGCGVCSPQTKYYFPWAAGSEQNRTIFANNLLNFIKTYRFDGVDLDWEYPSEWQETRTPADRDNFTLMVKKIRETFDAYTITNNLPKYVLSAATWADQNNVPVAYNLPELNKYFDHINLMSYDLYGAWDSIARPHTALKTPVVGDNTLFSVENAVDAYINNGWPASKLILGLGSYGRCVYLNDTNLPYNQTNLNAPKYTATDVTTGNPIGPKGDATASYGSMSYYEIKAKLSGTGASKIRDPITRTTIAQFPMAKPDGTAGHAWCGYDDIEDHNEKIQYLNAKGLGGAFFWAIDLDDFNNGFPLIRNVANQITYK